MEQITSITTIAEDTVESAYTTPDSSSGVTSATTLTDTPMASSPDEQVSSKAASYDVIQITDALLIGASKYRSKGIFAGKDGNTYKLSVGDGFYYDGTTLTVSGGISGGTIDIGGFDSSSFHVDIDGNVWLGAATYATAPLTMSSTGAVVVREITATSPSTTTVVGVVSHAIPFTAGQVITAGQCVAVNSADGKVYRTRVTAFGTQNAAVGSAIGASVDSVSSTEPNRHRFVRISSTVAVSITSVTNTMYATRFVIDPSSSTITSATTTSFSMSAGASDMAIDAVRLSDTSMMVVSSNLSDVYAMVLSGLDSGLTTNTRLTVKTSTGSLQSVAVAYVSATEAIVFYYVAATEVRATQLTISGTTITAGTNSTVYASATDQYLNSAIQFGTSSTYLVTFSQGTTFFRAIAGTYSSGALTMGSAITVETYNVVGTTAVSYDSTHAIVAYQKTTAAVGNARNISVSGTTLTSNAVYTTAANITANSTLTVAQLGISTFTLSYLLASDGNFHADLLELTGTTLSQLGSSLALTAFGTEYASSLIYHSPTRGMVMVHVANSATAWTVDLTNNHASWIGIANEDIALNATGYVVTHGASPSVTGLSTASVYYTDIDGGLTTTTTGTRVGVAYSSTKLVTRS